MNETWDIMDENDSKSFLSSCLLNYNVLDEMYIFRGQHCHIELLLLGLQRVGHFYPTLGQEIPDRCIIRVP